MLSKNRYNRIIHKCIRFNNLRCIYYLRYCCALSLKFDNRALEVYIRTDISNISQLQCFHIFSSSFGLMFMFLKIFAILTLKKFGRR